MCRQLHISPVFTKIWFGNGSAGCTEGKKERDPSGGFAVFRLQRKQSSASLSCFTAGRQSSYRTLDKTWLSSAKKYLMEMEVNVNNSKQR